MIDFVEQVRSFEQYLRQMPQPLSDEERTALRSLLGELLDLVGMCRVCGKRTDTRFGVCFDCATRAEQR